MSTELAIPESGMSAYGDSLPPEQRDAYTRADTAGAAQAKAAAETERITALADEAYARHPGEPLTAAQIDYLRPFLSLPAATGQAA